MGVTLLAGASLVYVVVWSLRESMDNRQSYPLPAIAFYTGTYPTRVIICSIVSEVSGYLFTHYPLFIIISKPQVMVSFSGLQKKAGGFHVHLKPVPDPPDCSTLAVKGFCVMLLCSSIDNKIMNCLSLPGHYNPFNVKYLRRRWSTHE